jgi:hypothetical protein
VNHIRREGAHTTASDRNRQRDCTSHSWIVRSARSSMRVLFSDASPRFGWREGELRYGPGESVGDKFDIDGRLNGLFGI